MPADIETLLAEAPWLARLARSLTGDAAEAEDIVQDAYAAALRSPPATDRPIRPWLRRVVVNLVRMRHRGRVRRAANEPIVEARIEPVRTPDELLERAQLERRLAELVIALDEPFRTTVLLRYREGLTAEHIAKQQGIPAATVRSRLKTGLDRLRRDLDGGERAQLRAAFAPLVVAEKARPLPTLGRIVMAKLTSKLGVAVLLLLLLLGGGALLVKHHQASAPQAGREAKLSPASQTAQHAKLATMFEQPGVAARRVRGNVTSDGAPFRGAVVRLIHAETEVLLGEATSGVDGTFDLGDRAADVYVVTASAPDRAAVPVRVDLRAPATPTIELRLTGCSHLRGTIVDGSGAPIDHARVALDGAAVPFAEADANGRYDLCTHFGNKWIRYSADGYQSVLVGLYIAASTTRDVVLIPEATVEGTVVTEDGAPVAGAWVVIDPGDITSERGARAGAFSARDGTFRITGVSPGRNLISGFAPGLRSSHKQQLVAGAGQATTGVVVRLVRGATISGVVVSGGVPVPGVGVGIRIGNRDQTGVVAVTQADGSFIVDRAPRGDIALYVENFTVLAPRSVHVDASTKVRIEVERLGGVRGRVLRGADPVAGAQVSCSRQTKIVTDASGKYQCEGIDSGAQELFADVPTGEWGSATVTVVRGETANLDIPLTFSAAICGRIVDEHGAPLPGLEVRVAEQKTGDFGKGTTASDGGFCARQLSGGTYEVAVYAGPRAIAPLEAIAAVTLGPRETKTLAIAVAAPRLSITGIVSDPQGAPVVDAIVRIVADRIGAPVLHEGVQSSLTLTDEAGRFTLTKLAPGDYALVVTARDGSDVIKQPIAAGSRDVAITLAAAGRIEGELVGFTTAPTITGVLVGGGRVFFEAEVDGQRFRSSGLSPGTYVLMAITDAREADTKQVIVRPGDSTRVTLANRGTTTVTGVVRDFRTRAPVAGLRCTAMAREGTAIGSLFMGPDEAVPTDARGAFRLTSPAGEISLLCMGANRSGNRLAIAARDRTTNIDVLTVALTQTEPGTIDAELEWLGRRIRELVKDGAADRAGLAIGDEVIAVDGVSVVDLVARELMLVITQRRAGTTAQLTILRGGTQRTITVTVRAPN
jgi:RNA polymerase sigma factor (sigma-70 family)